MLSDLVNQARRLILSFPSSAVSFQALLQYVVLAIALTFAHHFLLIKNGPNGPPMVRGPLPWLGVALSFLSNPEQFLLKCQKLHGDIFTLYMGGKRMHVVSDAISGIPTVYRNFKVFPFTLLSNHVDIVLFGLSEKQAKDSNLYKANLEKLAPNLLAQNMVDGLVQTFSNNLKPILDREIQKLNVDGQLGKDGVIIDLDSWLKKIMFESSGKALFGETWPTEDSFVEAHSQFDEKIYEIVKEYPYFLTRKGLQARERYYQRVLKMFKEPLVNPSNLIKERLKVESAHGYSLEDAVRNMMGIAFALQTNAIPTAFWLVAYLTCLKEDEKNEVLDRIQNCVVSDQSTRNVTSFDVADLLRDPVLNSAVSETLRMEFRGLSPRGISQDTTLMVNGRPFELQKGTSIFVSTTGVHKDPAIYQSPYEYRLKRYEHMHTKTETSDGQTPVYFWKNGAPIRHPLLPWGGGHFMCTGRKFAVGEILLFASTILHQFEIQSVDESIPLQLPVPPPLSRFGGGVELPARPWRVRIKYRHNDIAS